MLGNIEGKKRRGQQKMRQHHWLNGHEFGQTLGDSGQRSLVDYSHGVSKRRNFSEWTAVTKDNSKRKIRKCFFPISQSVCVTPRTLPPVVFISHRVSGKDFASLSPLFFSIVPQAPTLFRSATCCHPALMLIRASPWLSPPELYLECSQGSTPL